MINQQLLDQREKQELRDEQDIECIDEAYKYVQKSVAELHTYYTKGRYRDCLEILKSIKFDLVEMQDYIEKYEGLVDDCDDV